MATQDASLETIQDFLAQKRIAMVGISRDPANFSVKLFEELCRRGYDVVPVNPNTAEVQGRRCFARVQDIRPPVEAVLLIDFPKGHGSSREQLCPGGHPAGLDVPGRRQRLG